MRTFIKNLIPRTIKAAYLKWITRDMEVTDTVLSVEEWIAKGRPLPPPSAYKQRVFAEYRERFKPRIFVETGTYKGDTTASQIPFFNKLITIEVDKTLFENAQKRFADEPKVQVMHGDSGAVLKDLVPGLKEPALFWLDGHFSASNTGYGAKFTPVVEELQVILRDAPEHIVLIDDARLFTGEDDYPRLESLEVLVQTLRSSYSITVEHDIIRVVPKT